jgi:hypothetical protein
VEYINAFYVDADLAFGGFFDFDVRFAEDDKREKNPKAPGKRKPGGQPGHEGATLLPVENPDKTETIKLTGKHCLPALGSRRDMKGGKYFI